MIESFRHKGLRRLFEADDRRGLPADLVRRIGSILAALDRAKTLEALSLPSFRLHPLKGDLKGFWSVTVNGNWRIIFSFDDGQVKDVDLTDYH